MAIQQSYVAGSVALELAGAPAGFVRSAAGGDVFGEVVRGVVSGRAVDKSIGQTVVAPLVVDVDGSVGPLLSWVAAALSGTQQPTDGAIAFLNYNFREQRRLEWTAGLITEVVLPAADATSKESATIRVTIQPSSTRRVAGRGTTIPGVGGGVKGAKGAKAWVAANFRWSVPQLEAACATTVAVEPIVVRPQADGSVDVDDVRFVVSAVVADSFHAWLQHSLGGGRGDERSGTLTWLDPTLRTELWRVELGGLGVHRVEDLSAAAKSSSIGAVARTVVACYAETADLVVPKAESAPARPRNTVVPDERPAGSAGNALADVLAGRRADALPALSAGAIAQRLEATKAPAPSAVVGERDRGRAVGRAWAADAARLDELDDIAALADDDDWTDLTVGPDHSLIGFMTSLGLLDADAAPPGALTRDQFVAGLVAGAADIHRDVAPLLATHPPTQ